MNDPHFQAKAQSLLEAMQYMAQQAGFVIIDITLGQLGDDSAVAEGTPDEPDQQWLDTYNNLMKRIKS